MILFICSVCGDITDDDDKESRPCDCCGKGFYFRNVSENPDDDRRDG